MMEEMDNLEKKDRVEIYSRAVRAGKRTYFFDVKSTRSNDFYLTITESKKRFDQDGKYHYEKHKLFLYKEDFEKFVQGLDEVMEFIRSGKYPDAFEMENNVTANLNDVHFDDLDGSQKEM
ncbi:MAG: DUF3276 family protein [Bacteroidota bacterium]